MKIQGIISAAVLTSAVLSAPAFACAPGEGVLDTLSNTPGVITDITCGKYEFSGINSEYDTWFSNRWTLYATEDLTVSVSVFDFESDLDDADGKKFDTRDLSFTVFDNDAGQFLGWASENETLSSLQLTAGKWYTLKVYGNVGGIEGSTFSGILETSVTQVPVGPTAPLLGSALGLLALRLRKRAAADVNA